LVFERAEADMDIVPFILLGGSCTGDQQQDGKKIFLHIYSGAVKLFKNDGMKSKDVVMIQLVACGAGLNALLLRREKKEATYSAGKAAGN
jgi:hypothetical protein